MTEDYSSHKGWVPSNLLCIVHKKSGHQEFPYLPGNLLTNSIREYPYAWRSNLYFHIKSITGNIIVNYDSAALDRMPFFAIE